MNWNRNNLAVFAHNLVAAIDTFKSPAFRFKYLDDLFCVHFLDDISILIYYKRISKNLTITTILVYPSAQVFKTSPVADNPAPVSRGFFASIDFPWPSVGLIKDLLRQEIR